MLLQIGIELRRRDRRRRSKTLRTTRCVIIRLVLQITGLQLHRPDGCIFALWPESVAYLVAELNFPVEQRACLTLILPGWSERVPRSLRDFSRHRPPCRHLWLRIRWVVPFDPVCTRPAPLTDIHEISFLIANREQHSEEEVVIPRAVELICSIDEIIPPVVRKLSRKLSSKLSLRQRRVRSIDPRCLRLRWNSIRQCHLAVAQADLLHRSIHPDLGLDADDEKLTEQIQFGYP